MGSSGQQFTWIPRYFELDLQTNETKQLLLQKSPQAISMFFFFSSFSNMKIALPALICPAWEAKSKVIHSKYYKHLAYDLAHKKNNSVCFSLFWPIRVHFKAKIDSFLNFLLINFWVWTILPKNKKLQDSF